MIWIKIHTYIFSTEGYNCVQLSMSVTGDAAAFNLGTTGRVEGMEIITVFCDIIYRTHM